MKYYLKKSFLFIFVFLIINGVYSQDKFYSLKLDKDHFKDIIKNNDSVVYFTFEKVDSSGFSGLTLKVWPFVNSGRLDTANVFVIPPESFANGTVLTDIIKGTFSMNADSLKKFSKKIKKETILIPKQYQNIYVDYFYEYETNNSQPYFTASDYLNPSPPAGGQTSRDDYNDRDKMKIKGDKSKSKIRKH